MPNALCNCQHEFLFLLSRINHRLFRDIIVYATGLPLMFRITISIKIIAKDIDKSGFLWYFIDIERSRAVRWYGAGQELGMTYDFEQALDAYLERREYDLAAETLYSLVRSAFTAGWMAAGGRAPAPRPVIRLLPKEETT